MWLHGALCAATRSELATVVRPSSDPGYPFRLCEGSAWRLEHAALSPIEWLNLTSYYDDPALFESFYSPYGEAMQPMAPVPAGDFPEPGDVADNVERLLDLAIAWCLNDWSRSSPTLMECFGRLGAREILDEVSLRVRTGVPESNEGTLYAALGFVGRSEFAPYLRERHAIVGERFTYSFVSAGAVCLPPKEAADWFDRYVGSVEYLSRAGMSDMAVRIATRMLGQHDVEAAVAFIRTYLSMQGRGYLKSVLSDLQNIPGLPGRALEL